MRDIESRLTRLERTLGGQVRQRIHVHLKGPAEHEPDYCQTCRDHGPPVAADRVFLIRFADEPDSPTESPSAP